MKPLEKYLWHVFGNLLTIAGAFLVPFSAQYIRLIPGFAKYSNDWIADHAFMVCIIGAIIMRDYMIRDLIPNIGNRGRVFEGFLSALLGFLGWVGFLAFFVN